MRGKVGGRARERNRGGERESVCLEMRMVYLSLLRENLVAKDCNKRKEVVVGEEGIQWEIRELHWGRNGDAEDMSLDKGLVKD